MSSQLPQFFIDLISALAEHLEPVKIGARNVPCATISISFLQHSFDTQSVAESLWYKINNAASSSSALEVRRFKDAMHVTRRSEEGYPFAFTLRDPPLPTWEGRKSSSLKGTIAEWAHDWVYPFYPPPRDPSCPIWERLTDFCKKSSSIKGIINKWAHDWVHHFLLPMRARTETSEATPGTQVGRAQDLLRKKASLFWSGPIVLEYSKDIASFKPNTPKTITAFLSQ